MEESPDLDRELYRQLAKGHEEAFSAIYERFQRPIFRFAWHMSGNRALAEDVTQEAFMLLIRNPGKYDPAKGSVGGYLFGIARNLTRRKLERSRFDDPIAEECMEGSDAEFTSDIDVLADLTRSELLHSLQKAVLGLPAPYREVVVLCDLEEMSHPDAAAVLECPPGTIASRTAPRQGHAEGPARVQGMCEMNHSEDQLSEALRILNELAPDGASKATGEMLRDEFRRHHAQRSRKRAARIAVLASCLAASVILAVILARPRASSPNADHETIAVASPVEPIGADPRILPSTKPKARRSPKHLKGPHDQPVESDRFIVLPTFDPAIPIDRSDMVRLDLPGRALQLVGFPVSEEIADRRVVADVLLAQDGTPYALRLVQSSQSNDQTKEH